MKDTLEKLHADLLKGVKAGEHDLYVTTGLSDEKELRQPFCSSALVPPEKLLNCAMEHVELQPSKPPAALTHPPHPSSPHTPRPLTAHPLTRQVRRATCA